MEDNVKTFADYMAMFRRRKRLLLIVMVTVSVIGVYVTYSIEPVYVSTATFRVQQPTVSTDDLGQEVGSGSAEEQFQLARQAVTSVEYLSEVIDKHGLYPETTQGFAATRDAVEILRDSIEVEPEYAEVINQRTGRATFISIGFNVHVSYSDPANTQIVASEIANQFLIENRRSRSTKVEETIAFIERDLELNTIEVERATDALAEFRENNAGNLPELSDFNLQSIQRTERAIEELDAAIRLARDQIFLLETELADPNLLATVYDENGEPVVGTAQRLAELRRERLRLVSIYSEQHPDVVAAEREIAILESDLSMNRASSTELARQLEAARTELTLARQRYADDHPDVRRASRAVESLQLQLREAGDRPSQNSLVASQDPVVRQLQLRIEAQEADIASFQARRAEQVARIEEYERKQMQLPQIERELLRLTRDSEAAITRNTELREQLLEARTTGKLESESGTIFILTDPPRLPVKPFEPNRQSLLILTAVAALLIGGMAAIASDSMDKTVKDSQDVFRMLDAPPIAVIPYLETTSDRRRRIAAGAATSGFVLGAAALAMYFAQNAA